MNEWRDIMSYVMEPTIIYHLWILMHNNDTKKESKVVQNWFNPEDPNKKLHMHEYTVDMNSRDPMVVDALIKIRNEIEYATSKYKY